MRPWICKRILFGGIYSLLWKVFIFVNPTHKINKAKIVYLGCLTRVRFVLSCFSDVNFFGFGCAHSDGKLLFFLYGKFLSTHKSIEMIVCCTIWGNIWFLQFCGQNSDEGQLDVCRARGNVHFINTMDGWEAKLSEAIKDDTLVSF